jgi:phosphatidylglycerophosphate synthase
MLDPLADKILLVTSFICLALQDWIPRWLAVLVVSRDVIIVGGLTLLQYSGVDVRGSIRPVWFSKLATLAQISLVLLIMVGTVFAVGPAGLIVELCSQSGASGVLTSLLFWLIIILVYYFIATFISIDAVIGKIYPIFGIKDNPEIIQL